MKIAVLLNSDRTIRKINNTNEDGVHRQSALDGSIIVEADTTFKVDESYLWTVRPEDNALVHISSNQTPEEEKNTVITNLTLQNLQQVTEITELKKISTAQTLQSLQDAQDKEGLQKVITNQTMQILDLQKSITDIKSATN
ncbi:hypothetical protein [Companilactobacillus musae]|uniref:hypothetical protein n=1 Tax=Companilactobacillus musae TaxID=1903258 RepID=UPI0034417080